MGAVSNALNIARDPAELGYPATLPIEIALRTGTTREICEGYGLTHADWQRLRTDPIFVEHLARVVESLKKDGMSFKLKAQLQADELLKKSWAMIHSPSDMVPPAVQADLLKATIRWAGLDEKPGSRASEQQVVVPLQINLNLG